MTVVDMDRRRGRDYRWLPAWPLPGAYSLIALVAIFALSAVSSFAAISARYPRWADESAAWHDRLVAVGPAIAFWAAIVGWSVGGRGSVFLTLGVGRRLRQFLTHVSMLSVWSLVAYALGQIPSLVWTARAATWGHPYIADAVVAVASIVGCVVLGFTLGALLPARRWLVLPVIVVALWLVAPVIMERAFSVITPTHFWPTGPSFAPNPAVTLFFVITVVALTGCAMVLWQARSTAALHVGSLVMLGVALLALVATPFVWRPELFVAAPGADPLCDASGGTRICVHPAHQRSMPVLTAQVEALQRAGLTGYMGSVSDMAITGSKRPYSPTAIDIYISPESTADDMLQQLSDQTLGMGACPMGTDPDSQRRNAIALATQSRVLVMSGASGAGSSLDPDISQRVDAIPAGSFRKLLVDERRAIQSCSLKIPVAS